MRVAENNESGFTVIEVAVASVITMVGLIFLAGLFTLAISQNRVVQQFTSTTALAQEKMEELNALENNDKWLTPGGNINGQATVTGVGNYFDSLNEKGKSMGQGETPHYNRFWSIQADPQLANTVIIAVRVVSVQAGRNAGTAEETTLTTVRSW